MRLRFLALLPILAGVAVVALWLSSELVPKSAPLASASTSTTAPNFASTSTWANEGAAALAAPLAPVPTGDINDQVGAPGVFPPTLSQPVNVSQIGDITLTAGPVTPTSKPTTINVVLPPDSRSFFAWHVPFVEYPTLVTLSGASYVQIVIDVTAVTKPYNAFTAWFM